MRKYPGSTCACRLSFTMTDKMILMQIPAFCLQQIMNIKAPQKQSMVSPIYTATLQLKSLLAYICTLKSLKHTRKQTCSSQNDAPKHAGSWALPACFTLMCPLCECSKQHAHFLAKYSFSSMTCSGEYNGSMKPWNIKVHVYFSHTYSILHFMPADWHLSLRFSKTIKNIHDLP